MIYAGVGARKTPDEILQMMRGFAGFMAQNGHTLRSGGSWGADYYFELGCDDKKGKKEIYLPYEGFRGHTSPLFGSCLKARTLAKRFHPYWHNLGDTGRAFQARNMYQVAGQDLETPADFLICWTPEGKPVGGTSQALRVAEFLKMKIFNLGSMNLDTASDEIVEWLSNQ